MKHIKEIKMWFDKPKEGDSIVSRILDITKEEKIKIYHDGGYRIEIDDHIYSFSRFDSANCFVNKYNISQKITSGEYKGFITGYPISKYNFSNKLWKELVEIHESQQKDIDTDLDNLDPVKRASKKFNL